MSRQGAPKLRLVLRVDARSLDEQVTTPGPVWLDRIDSADLARATCPSSTSKSAPARSNPPSSKAALMAAMVAADTPGYAILSDVRELVVLPMTRELRAAVGRDVSAERDTTGKLRFQVVTLDRGG